MSSHTLFIFRGLPGAGKTTRALRLGSERDVVAYAADDFFYRDGVYTFDGDKLPQAHAVCQAKTRRVLEAGEDCIVHNTFVEGWEATPYLTMAQETGASVEVIDLFDGGLDDAALAARNEHGVPEFRIADMRRRWDEDLLVAQAAEPRPPWGRK